MKTQSDIPELDDGEVEIILPDGSKIPSDVLPSKQEVLDHLSSKSTWNSGVKEYPEHVKAAAIAYQAEGESYRQVASRLNVGVASVYRWCNELGEDDRVNSLAERIKGQMASRCLIGAFTAMSRVTDDDYEKASLLQKGTFSAMMVDKYLLLSGQSTENIAVIYKKSDQVNNESESTDNELIVAKAKAARLRDEIGDGLDIN